MSLRTVALLYEGDGRPALYICADGRSRLPALYRVPEDTVVRVEAPYPLPEDRGRVFLPAGSRVVFETPDGLSALALYAVQVCRELLEALESYAHARQIWQETFEDSQPRKPGEGPHLPRPGKDHHIYLSFAVSS